MVAALPEVKTSVLVSSGAAPAPAATKSAPTEVAMKLQFMEFIRDRDSTGRLARLRAASAQIGAL